LRYENVRAQKNENAMSCHADALARAKELENISDKNLIYYFTPELVWIGEGQRAKTLLPDSVIQNFVRIGILRIMKGPSNHVLTDKALNIIQKLRK